MNMIENSFCLHDVEKSQGKSLVYSYVYICGKKITFYTEILTRKVDLEYVCTSEKYAHVKHSSHNFSIEHIFFTWM